MLDEGITVEAKHRKNSHRSNAVMESERIIRSRRLLKEVDTLALLLEEVKQQTEKIQAQADAIGDFVIESLNSDKPPALSSEQAKRASAIGAKLGIRSRSDGSFAV